MTTIAYRHGIIAVDSLATAGGVIINNSFNKITKKNDVVFVTTGNLHNKNDLINAYFGKDYDKNADIDAIIEDDGQVYVAGLDKDHGFWKFNITGGMYAIGSGSDHAWTAMDMGCDAEKAVRMAMKRDIYTGGRVIIHKVVK